MGQDNLLGAYLRACRERISPAAAAVQSLGQRRVAGLRREEVALLAGISANYYLRLEQGRDRHPSQQVLESLARALRLDDTETAHLMVLGQPRPRDMTGGARMATVPASIGQLLSALDLPAWVQDEHFDVAASNAMARAFSPAIRPGQNRMRSMFLDPDERAMFVDWEAGIGQLVASFRASVGADADDPRTNELASELSTRDARFRELWATYDVANRVDRPPVRFAHPVVGRLTLTRDNLAIDGPDALRLMVYHAARGSVDAAKLAQLRKVACAETLQEAVKPAGGK